MTFATMRSRWYASMALAVTLFASACTGGKNGAKEDSFYWNIGGEPTTINPVTSTDYYSSLVQDYVLESLLDRDIETNEWKPALADKWEISPDGKVFTFHLRQGVQWQDGKPVTADDVKFSFDVIMDPKYPTAHLRPYLEGIAKAEIVDPQTVRFYAKEKYFGNFNAVAGGIIKVLPKHIYEGFDKDNANLNKTLVGTGPYILEKYEKGNRIILKKNDKWWAINTPEGKGRWNFPRVVLRFVQEENISLEMFKKGDFDYESLTPEQYVEKTNGPEWGSKVFKVKTTNLDPRIKGYGFIAWNLNNPIFADRNVRVGLAHLINRELMIQKFLYGMSDPATGPWHQSSEYASPNVKPIPYDPKKALELFRKAGWADTDGDGVLDKVIKGKKTPFRFTVVTASKDFLKYLTMYKEDAKQMGVDININFVEWNSLVKLVDERKFDALNMGWSGGDVDLDPKQIWHSTSAKGGSNFNDYNNPEVDKLIDQGRAELDKSKRVAIFRKVYEKIAADAPYAFLFNSKYVMYGYNKRVKRPQDTFKYKVGIERWSLEKSK